MSSDTDETLLNLDDISVHYADESAIMEVVPDSVKARFDWEEQPVRAVDGVSLDVGENDVVALVGESGSGKTTLGKAAVGLEEVTDGEVRYRGTDFWELKENGQIDGTSFQQARKALQIVHQDPGAALNPYRTIMATLTDPLKRWYPDLTAVDRRERILSLFDECGLTPPREYEDRYPHELSGGEKQRVTLVRAMLAEPDLILADEPVSALDVSLRVELMDLMITLQQRFETSFLFVTHDLKHARYIAGKTGGRIAVMYLGEIVEIGPAEEVIRNPKHPYTQILKWATLPSHPDDAQKAIQATSPLRKRDIPDPVDPPSGCRFHTRCPKAREACVDESPDQYSESGNSHKAACFREIPDHRYWQSEHLNEDGEIMIPE
jgi:peptide/nickel transport system ATP-binding protein